MLRSRFVTPICLAILVAWVNAPAQEKTNKRETADRQEARRDNTKFRSRGNLISSSSGEVLCSCAGASTPVGVGQSLAGGDAIQISHGRVEVLLNPGYYLRLGDNTEVSFLDLSPSNLKIKLLRGSAIFEIASDGWHPYDLQELKEQFFNVVTVITPQDEFAIARAGIYRLDVMADGRSEIRVGKGRLAVRGYMMKDKTRASIVDGRVESSVLEEKSVDDFDAWSRDRAQALIRLNKALRKREWFKEMSNDFGELEIPTTDLVRESKISRTISARAGMVEFAEKGTSIMHPDSDWEELKTDQPLSNGDGVRTTREARAEIRPYPDFYLFLGGDTEIRYTEDQQGGVKVLVLQGTVILSIPQTEVSAKFRNELALIADNAEYHISKHGRYRMTVPSKGASELIVRFGSVKTSTQEISAAKTIVSNSSGVNVSPFDRASLNSLDVWADHRMARYVSVETRFSQMRSRWYAGMWFFDEATNEFTLVPGGRPFKSPYGGEYAVVYTFYPKNRKRRPSQ